MSSEQFRDVDVIFNCKETNSGSAIHKPKIKIAIK